MGKEKVRFALVGCGEIAMYNARAVAEARNAEIACALDVKASLAKDMGERYKVPWTTDYDEVLKNEEVDAVVISTPHALHAPMGIQAAEAGKHVIVEKPIATTVRDAERLVAACEKAKVALSVAFVMRYEANVAKAKELLDQEVIGRVIATEVHALARKPDSYWEGGYSGRAKSDWRKSLKMSGGGILIMNCVHSIDLLYYLTRLKPTLIWAQMDTFTTKAEVEDYIVVTYRYENGAIGNIVAGSRVEGGEHADVPPIRIIGSDGQILFRGGLEVYTTRNVPALPQNAWKRFPPRKQRDARTRFVEDFASAVIKGSPPPISGSEAIPSLSLCAMAYQAAQTGRPQKG